VHRQSRPDPLGQIVVRVPGDRQVQLFLAGEVSIDMCSGQSGPVGDPAGQCVRTVLLDRRYRCLHDGAAALVASGPIAGGTPSVGGVHPGLSCHKGERIRRTIRWYTLYPVSYWYTLYP
jgi:hypothetical protein